MLFISLFCFIRIAKISAHRIKRYGATGPYDTKVLKGHGNFQKKPLVNRYIELCNPFSRISNSFPRIRQLSLPSNYTIRSLGLHFVPSNWTIRSLGLKCVIRGNDLQLERSDCVIRRKSELSNSRERITNP